MLQARSTRARRFTIRWQACLAARRPLNHTGPHVANLPRGAPPRNIVDRSRSIFTLRVAVSAMSDRIDVESPARQTARQCQVHHERADVLDGCCGRRAAQAHLRCHDSSGLLPIAPTAQ